MNIKQKTINKLVYFLFIYLFFYSFQIIKADEVDEADECTEKCKLENKKCTHMNPNIESCPSYCVPDLARGSCFYCQPNMDSTLYYIFRDDLNYTCQLEPHCGGNKLVFNTRQCIRNCAIGPIKFFEMDGICYTQEDSKKGNRKCSSSTCSCINTYSREFFINNNIYTRHCYNSNEKCGPEHAIYDFDSKLCGITSCGTKKRNMKQEIDQQIS